MKIKYFLFLILATTIFSQDLLNEVVAMAANKPVTLMDLEIEKEKFLKNKEIPRDHRNIESQVLDMLIAEKIVDIVAEEESIIISEDKINNYIKQEMKARNIPGLPEFEKILKSDLKISLEEYKSELSKQLKTQQIMQLKVAAQIPKEDDLEKWYRANKSKIGNKYLTALVLMKYPADNVKEELRVNKLMNEVRLIALENFSAAASKNSDHPSASKGGTLPWLRLDQLAQEESPMLAQMVMQLKKNEISPVSKGESGYFFVKLLDTKSVELDDIKEQVRNLLYSQNQQAAFVGWIKEERKKVAVKIFLKNYQEL